MDSRPSQRRRLRGLQVRQNIQNPAEGGQLLFFQGRLLQQLGQQPVSRGSLQELLDPKLTELRFQREHPIFQNQRHPSRKLVQLLFGDGSGISLPQLVGQKLKSVIQHEPPLKFRLDPTPRLPEPALGKHRPQVVKESCLQKLNGLRQKVLQGPFFAFLNALSQLSLHRGDVRVRLKKEVEKLAILDLPSGPAQSQFFPKLPLQTL